MRGVGALMVAWPMVTFGCLTPPPVHISTDPIEPVEPSLECVKGRQEFEAGNLSAARSDLDQCLAAHCDPFAGDADCQRALWTHGKAETQLGRPAYALADFRRMVGTASKHPAGSNPEAASNEMLGVLAERRRALGATVELQVTLRNDIGSALELISARVRIDGQRPIELEPGVSGAGDASIQVRVETGDHFIEVYLVYAGARAGLFGYKFNIRSSRTFDVLPSGPRDLTVVLSERGSAALPIQDRLRVDFLQGGNLLGGQPQ